MNIENEIFKRTQVDFKKLEPFGFIKENNIYHFNKKFMNNQFSTIITINQDGKISGKVIDLDIGEEYTNIRVENQEGSFTNMVRELYKEILIEIRDNCFINNFFITDQANRIANYILKKYNDEPEFLWEKYNGFGVFRNKNNNKWYAFIGNIDKSKISDSPGEIEIINLKSDEKTINELIKKDGFYKGYHMNKKNWITITLDNTLTDEEIIKYIDISYNMINGKEEWIIPANPKYYDIINCFNNTDIIEWKQSSNIHIGDIIYIYVTAPYSSIMFKCEAIEVNIPFDYKDKNLSIKRVIRIKLLKRYKEKEISFENLKKLGITSIRGPRKVNKVVSKKFN